MTYRIRNACRHCSLLVAFMLFFHVCNAQYDFSKVNLWLKDNLTDLGGRAVLMVYKDGKIVYNKAENDLKGKQKFAGKIVAKRTGKDADEVLQDYDENSRINIASCSKWLSAALVMTFVEEGKLRLDDSIGKYLPIMTKRAKGNITIADCLSHMTGIKSEQGKENRAISGAENMDEAIGVIADLPIESTHGTSFHYSSIGLQIAAAVLENISKENFEQLFLERIAKSCDMLHTDFNNKKVPLAAGGAMSTTADYLNFLKMILAKGNYNGKQVLSESSIELMQKNYTFNKKIIYSPLEGGNWGYGFGEWIISAQSVTSPGLFGSFPWIDKENNYAAVLFVTNIKNKGRHEKYLNLKGLIDAALQK